MHYLLGGGGPEVPKLRAEASRLGLSSGEVEFHAGFSGEDYIRVLRESEVYLLPSFRETTGMTLVEAMVAGCYPIVADASAQGEIIREFGGDAIPTISIESLVCGLADAIERGLDPRQRSRAPRTPRTPRTPRARLTPPRTQVIPLAARKKMETTP